MSIESEDLPESEELLEPEEHFDGAWVTPRHELHNFELPNREGIPIPNAQGVNEVNIIPTPGLYLPQKNDIATYVNAVIQALSHVPCFAKLMLNPANPHHTNRGHVNPGIAHPDPPNPTGHVDVHLANENWGNCLYCIMESVTTRMLDLNSAPALKREPEVLWDNIDKICELEQYSTNVQGDPRVFLDAVLQIMANMERIQPVCGLFMRLKPALDPYSPIFQTFGMLMQTSSSCHQCNQQHVNYNMELSLRVYVEDRDSTLDRVARGLKKALHKVPVQNFDAGYLENASELCRTCLGQLQQKMWFRRAPNVLILHTVWSQLLETRRKARSKYEPTLNITEFLADLPEGHGQVIYKLKSVVGERKRRTPPKVYKAVVELDEKEDVWARKQENTAGSPNVLVYERAVGETINRSLEQRKQKGVIMIYERVENSPDEDTNQQQQVAEQQNENDEDGSSEPDNPEQDQEGNPPGGPPGNNDGEYGNPTNPSNSLKPPSFPDVIQFQKENMVKSAQTNKNGNKKGKKNGKAGASSSKQGTKPPGDNGGEYSNPTDPSNSLGNTVEVAQTNKKGNKKGKKGGKTGASSSKQGTKTGSSSTQGDNPVPLRRSLRQRNKNAKK